MSEHTELDTRPAAVADRLHQMANALASSEPGGSELHKFANDLAAAALHLRSLADARKRIAELEAALAAQEIER